LTILIPVIPSCVWFE